MDNMNNKTTNEIEVRSACPWCHEEITLTTLFLNGEATGECPQDGEVTVILF